MTRELDRRLIPNFQKSLNYFRPVLKNDYFGRAARIKRRKRRRKQRFSFLLRKAKTRRDPREYEPGAAAPTKNQVKDSILIGISKKFFEPVKIIWKID